MATARQDLSELLERNGVRATPRRLEVLEELAQERDDVTAQQLWSRLRERDSRAGCGAHLVRHLELADQLRHPRGTGELGTVRELADHSAVGGLGIGTKLGQPRLVGHSHDCFVCSCSRWE